MVILSKLLVDKITLSCINLYKKLPKSGKPIEKEWTVLSCIVKYDSKTDISEIVSLGTGSKCIGATKMTPSGEIMNDSHAEVFARRGFLIFIYDNIHKALSHKQSIFTYENGRFSLKEGVEFIFYSSQLPCGDAAIILKSGDEEHIGEILSIEKQQYESDICEVQIKRPRLDNSNVDVHRTGAKCLPGFEQDSKQPGVTYHLLGQVRTKPGRGDRTLSVSCSDKMARWIHLGIQGALLELLLKTPVYIKHFIFGGGVPYSEETLKRALLGRAKDKLLPPVIPEFYQSSVVFDSIRTENNLRPASGSIVWVDTDIKILEVAVQGRKLGVTKKEKDTLKSSLCISKYNIYKQFLEILYKNPNLKQDVCGVCSLDSVSYNDMKRKSFKYCENWKEVKKTFFKTWTEKPDIWNFCVNIT